MDSRIKETTDNLEKLLLEAGEITDRLNELQEASKALYEASEDPFIKGLYKDLNKGCTDAGMKLAITMVEISSKEIVFWDNWLKGVGRRN